LFITHYMHELSLQIIHARDEEKYDTEICELNVTLIVTSLHKYKN